MRAMRIEDRGYIPEALPGDAAISGSVHPAIAGGAVEPPTFLARVRPYETAVECL